jgi:hypothetical protein
LKSIGYISSFNKAGRYYTLKHIPEFDDSGIWRYKEASFSEYGSLKDTVHYMTDNSKAGNTQLELQKTLEVRVHNTLLDLVSGNAISRKLFAGIYVYTSIDPTVQTFQLAEREKLFALTQRECNIDPFITIETLRAVIRHPDYSSVDIGSYLIKEGVKVSIQQVKEIFSFYELGKKNSQ